MAKKITEGVGKKIVEALKKQSEIEITPIAETPDDDLDIVENNEEIFSEEPEEETLETLSEDNSNDIFADEPNFAPKEPEININSSINNNDLSRIEEPVMQAFNYQQQMQNKVQDNFISDLDSFEIPSNIAVLKKLISQLPSGVSKHTGAQIIKQTMEALGISMKGVLQEAQQVQDGLNTSAKECMSNIQEYKKQIVNLEKQAQNYHRQYSALNELISLFIQTGL